MADTMNRGNPWPRLPQKALIAPSLLACDFARAGEQINEAVSAGADVLHVDIMDGHFVPNLSMGPPFVKSIRAFIGHPLDVHIMVTDPAYYIERFAEVGADSITFHVEATDDAPKLIRRLRELGLGAAVTLKPGTEPDTLKSVIEDVDMVLVMTVEPGYGGQKFMDDMLAKVGEVRKMLRPEQRLEVDGGINVETAPRCVRAGADVFVAGANIFGSGDITAALQSLRRAIDAA
ncbi:MAG: ribulose-phosphate 3-epimerase [Planctomycetota bacterium]